MMTELPPGLEHWARLPGPRLVLAALRDRAERGHRLDAGTLRAALTEQQRREVALLLGTPWGLSGSSLSLRLLASRLAEHGLTAGELVQAVGGPVIVRSEARTAAREQELAARQRAAQVLVDAGLPGQAATAWALDVPASDLPSVADAVARVWQHLPLGAQPVRLAQLAADVFNDSHALDATTHLGRVVARLAAAVNDLPRPRQTGTAWRAAWRSVGVLCDTASSRVLVLNLPLRGRSPAAAICVSVVGEPVWLTQRMLEQEWSCEPVTVHVCENPTVLEAAADALARRCPPLVCTDGIASVAATGLIAGLATSGCQIIARADFDDAGLTIVDQITAAAPTAQMWRFDQATYAGLLPAGKEEATSVAGLREAIKIGGTIHEERLLDTLLDDLRREADR
jgi:uncharacterized protein (TIGR02679 family)